MDDFKNISLRARIAYSILCLNNVIREKEADNNLEKDWQLILDKLWEITEIEFVDEWMYSVSCRIPSSILEDPFDSNEDITEREFIALKNLYSNSDSVTLEIIELVYNLGTIEMYGRIEDCSPRTLDILEEIVTKLKYNNIELPNLAQFKKYTMNNNGWGVTFNRADLTDPLK
ncbi:MAG: hypothetical protein Crog4KO_07540 [Crocinitomicaceae bacterium]